MLKNNNIPPSIKIDGNIIVEGNHRYIAGRLFGKTPDTVPTYRATFKQSEPIINWEDLLYDKKDWGNK